MIHILASFLKFLIQFLFIFFIIYVFFPRTAHRIVGYFEDEAVYSYTEYLKEIDEGIKRANENSISRAHYIRKWTLIPGDFTVGGGELTPTLKLKRKTTASKYADAILKLYQDPKL